MFRREKPAPAEQVARELALRVIDPETCRRAAASLPGRPSPDPVGSCEMAFAGAGTLKHVIADTQAPDIAARMNGVVDKAVADAFSGAHTPETEDHYGPESLAGAAAAAVARYQADAFFSKRLVETMGARLGMAGPLSMTVARVFSEITEDSALTISKVKIA